MVDPITGAGGSGNVGPVGRTQNNRQSEQTTETGASEQVASGDQVELSPEALEAQANDNASAARTLLEQDENAVLSSDASRLNQLL